MKTEIRHRLQASHLLGLAIGEHEKEDRPPARAERILLASSNAVSASDYLRRIRHSIPAQSKDIEQEREAERRLIAALTGTAAIAMSWTAEIIAEREHRDELERKIESARAEKAEE